MKTVSSNFKNEITKIGRQYKNKINLFGNDYLATQDNQLILTQSDMKLIVGVSDTITKTLEDDMLFNITLSRKTRILATAMKELDFESYEDIRVGNIIEYEFGLKIGNDYIQTTDETFQSGKDYYELDDDEYILLEQGTDYEVGDTITGTIYNNQDIYEWVNYGKYIVYSKEFNEDTKTYSYVCYDNMLKTMVPVDNETPIDNITVKQALTNLATRFKYKIVQTGKNILDIKDITTTGYITNNQDGTITLNGQGTGGISFALTSSFILKANTTYTLSLTNTNSSYSNATFILRNGNTNKVQIGFDTSNVSYTPTEDTTIDTLRIYAPAGVTFNDFTFSIQLEEGSTATYYERYYNIDEEYVNLAKTIAEGVLTNIDNTYRDVMDMMCQALGTTMVLDNNKLYLKSLQQPSVDTIGKEFLKDTNVSFGKKYGPINALILSRGDNADIEKKDTASVKVNGATTFKIKDNLILSGDDRTTYMDGIFNEINGAEFYLNDISSTGIGYIELVDFYNINIDNNSYKCLMLDSEYKIKSGISEQINSEQPEETDTEFSTSTKSTKDVSMEINQQKTNIDNKVNKGEVIFSINNSVEENIIHNDKLNMIINNNESNLKNITEYSNALDKIYGTDIYKFNFLNENNDDKKTIGFIRGDTQYTDDIVGTKDGYTGANLFSMVSVLWQGVKELEAGGVDIPQQDTPPTNPQEDDLWIDTSEVNGAKPLDVYSTTEHKVGIWINGKPVYEKQIEGTTTAGGQKTVLIDSNLKRGWITEGYVLATTGGSMIPLNYYSSSSIYIKSTVLSDGNFSITTGSNSGYINGNFTATVRYTKTTD